jgi:hypothetical protein
MAYLRGAASRGVVRLCALAALPAAAALFTGCTPYRIDIQPGMTASIEIRTGSNTVLRFLLKPVIKTLHEALGER